VLQKGWYFMEQHEVFFVSVNIRVIIIIMIMIMKYIKRHDRVCVHSYTSTYVRKQGYS